MKLEITYKYKDETFIVDAKGFFFFPFIHFSNNPKFLKYIIKLDKKLYGGTKITEYYPPQYIGENNMSKQKSIDGKKQADENTIEYKKTITLHDGLHDGLIESLNRSERGGYDYLDINIMTETEDKKELVISASMPVNISDFSMLGQILKESEFDMTYGDNISIFDINEHLKGKEITFQTKTETTDKGKFARVINDTIKFK